VTTAARSFGYDLAGRLVSTTGSGGANTFTYDDRFITPYRDGGQ
jgi:hypothetical protein